MFLIILDQDCKLDMDQYLFIPFSIPDLKAGKKLSRFHKFDTSHDTSNDNCTKMAMNLHSGHQLLLLF